MHGWDISNFNSEFHAFAKALISAASVYLVVATNPLQFKDAYQITLSLCLDALPTDDKPNGKSKCDHNDRHSHMCETAAARAKSALYSIFSLSAARINLYFFFTYFFFTLPPDHLSTLPLASSSGPQKRLADCAHLERCPSMRRLRHPPTPPRAPGAPRGSCGALEANGTMIGQAG
jgi:hypothetical protein